MSNLLQELDVTKYISDLSFQAYRAQSPDSKVEEELTDNDVEAEVLSHMLNSQNNILDPLLQMSFEIKAFSTRFTKANCIGMWYGSEDLETSFTEVTHWLSREYIGDFQKQFLTYKIDIKTKQGIDFSSHMLEHTKSLISNDNTDSYSFTNKLGDSMILNDIEAFIYFSARKSNKKNVAVISHNAFVQRKIPKNSFKSFTCKVLKDRAIFTNNTNQKEKYTIAFVTIRPDIK